MNRLIPLGRASEETKTVYAAATPQSKSDGLGRKQFVSIKCTPDINEAENQGDVCNDGT